MMAHARPRGRNRRPGIAPHGWWIFTRPEQHWLFRLLGLIIRARAELTVITTLVVVYLWLTEWLAPDPQVQPLTGHPTQRAQPSDEWFDTDALLVMGAGIAILAIIPYTRRYLGHRMWCVITRHRLRACMIQTFTMARANGRLPFLLWARPSPVGEHVLVWLPAGMAVKDLESVTSQLAAACWATDTRILPSRRRAFFAHIHVIRRDTLGTAELSPEVIDHLNQPDRSSDDRPAYTYPYLVRDPEQEQERAALAALTPAINRTTATAASSTSDGTTAGSAPPSTPPHTASVTAGATAGPANTATTGKPTTARTPNDGDSDTAVTGYGGLDVSDYV